MLPRLATLLQVVRLARQSRGYDDALNLVRTAAAGVPQWGMTVPCDVYEPGCGWPTTGCTCLWLARRGCGKSTIPPRHLLPRFGCSWTMFYGESGPVPSQHNEDCCLTGVGGAKWIVEFSEMAGVRSEARRRETALRRFISARNDRYQIRHVSRSAERPSSHTASRTWV